MATFLHLRPTRPGAARPSGRSATLVFMSKSEGCPPSTANKKAVRHGVVPAAGLGTRFLPATKAVPKEMLPIVDRPAIQYVAEEATNAGITDLLFVTAARKSALVDHFDTQIALEDVLEADGKTELLAAVRAHQKLARVHAIRQGRPLGLGHAVLQARHHVGDNPFAVLLPDDLMHPEDALLARMIEVRQALGGSVVALLEVTPQEATAYGSAAVTELPAPAGTSVAAGDLFRIDKVVEKPELANVLSPYAVVGRYVLDPAIFDILENLPAGRGGEIQLTDALQQLITLPAEEGGGLYGLVVRGRRFDTGDKVGYLQAVVSMALEDPELGPRFRTWLEEDRNN